MARALVMDRADVGVTGREAYLHGARERRAAARAAGCNFWLFEGDTPGAFVEFVEGADAASVGSALAAGARPARSPGATILHEVELR